MAKIIPKLILKFRGKPVPAGVLLAVVVVIAGAAGVLLLATASSNVPKAAIKPLVLTDTCAPNNPTFTCYKKQLTDIVNQQSPEQAVTLIKNQYGKVAFVKSECHQLTHVVGRAAYAKYGNIGDTFAHGDQYCWSGYYHGVMEQLTSEKGYDYTIKNANTICAPIAAKGKYTFYHYNCVHGLGHGFMEALDNDLFASLKACDSLYDNWEASSCHGGVFMQNIMNVQSPDETVDHTSKYLKPDQPMYPCTVLDTKYKEQCYLMQTSYALQIANYDYSKIFAECGAVEPQFVDTCYRSLGRDVSGNTVSDAQRTKELCNLGPTDDAKKLCINGAAVDFVSYFHSDQQAKQLCYSLDSSDLQSYCLVTVKNYYAKF